MAPATPPFWRIENRLEANLRNQLITNHLASRMLHPAVTMLHCTVTSLHWNVTLQFYDW